MKRRKTHSQIMYTVKDCGTFRTDMFFNTKRFANLNRYGPEVVVKVRVTEVLPRKRGRK